MKFANDISEFLYQEYVDIENGSYHEKLRFYEANKKDIASLPYEHRLEICINYVVALFETGNYYGYLKHIDQLLRIVIEDNIYSVDGDDIYQELLFRKANALHNVIDRYGADHVYSELIKINPKNSLFQRAFLKNRIENLRYQGQAVRSGLISLFLLAGLIIGIEILVINNYLEAYSSITEWIRNGIFLTGVFGLIAQELYLRYQASSALSSLQKK